MAPPMDTAKELSVALMPGALNAKGREDDRRTFCRELAKTVRASLRLQQAAHVRKVTDGERSETREQVRSFLDLAVEGGKAILSDLLDACGLLGKDDFSTYLTWVKQGMAPAESAPANPAA